MILIPKFRNRHFFLFDLILLTLTPVIALSLRVNLPWGREYLPSLVVYTGLALLIKLPVFYFFRLYARYWPFASIDALVMVTLAVAIATALVTGLNYNMNEDLPVTSN